MPSGSPAAARGTSSGSDARTGKVTHAVDVAGDATSLVDAGGALWVATITPGIGDVVTRIDLQTRRTRTFRVADDSFLISASGTAVFAAGGSRALSRISLFSDQVDEIEFDSTVAGLVADISGVWVATTERQSVWRLDKFGKVMFTLAMPGRPEAIAVDDRRPAVYVAVPDARALVRIAPRTRTVYDVDTALKLAPGLVPRSVAVREGDVWLTVGGTRG